MPITLTCPCGKVFATSQGQINRGRKFCSRSCWHQYGGRAGGATRHELYHTWENIKVRTRKHHRYAGRGIGLHEPWAADSARFIADVEREIGPRPTGHTLDRIDNERGYEPGNLRWATATDQQHNRSQRGVTPNRNGWVAQITREYRHWYVGYFASEPEAHAAYLATAAAYERGGVATMKEQISAYRKRPKAAHPL